MLLYGSGSGKAYRLSRVVHFSQQYRKPSRDEGDGHYGTAFAVLGKRCVKERFTNRRIEVEARATFKGSRAVISKAKARPARPAGHTLPTRSWPAVAG